MFRFLPFWTVLLICPLLADVSADENFYALRFEQKPPVINAWGLADRSGGAQQVGPYLSSLVAGEMAVGRIAGPVFTLDADRVVLTLNGHDGPGGGAQKNRIELCDADSGAVLRQMFALGRDDFGEYSWDTADIKGRSVFLAAVDDISQTGFAWLGVQKIDAGIGSVDFSTGVLPPTWKIVPPEQEEKELPIQRITNVPVPSMIFGDRNFESLVPTADSVTIDCGGASVSRVFLLGATTNSHQLLLPGATVDFYYADGQTDRVPLMYGFTLAYMRHQSADAFLWPIGDGARSVLAIAPRQKPLAKIGLTREKGARPKILAITCAAAFSDGAAVPDAMIPAEGVLDGDYAGQLATITVSAADWNTQFDAAEVYRQHGVAYTAEQWQKVEPKTPVLFKRVKIADTAFEAAAIADVSGDGQPDLVSGDFWYEGPEFTKAHKYAAFDFDGNYYDDFSDLPMDVNRDGRVDIVSGGWTGGVLRWLENSENSDTLWPVHEIAKTGPIETSRLWDVDGDGTPEVVPNAGPDVAFYRLDSNTGEFARHVVAAGKSTHGIGFGDINGDGRGDFVNGIGWFEAPADRFGGEWTAHEEFNLGAASVPILVYDVNGDGLADLIYGAAHDYGIFWLEQKAADGRREWIRHEIDLDHSQYHDLILADLDGNGSPELISGKRYHAHCGHDPGAEDPLHLRFWHFNRGRFERHTIDFGPAGVGGGMGIAAAVADVNGDGRADILAAGKEGLYLYINETKPPRR